MAGLSGYIVTFLGASLFNLAGGIPLVPLQTLWVSFTTLSLQSVGLGGHPLAVRDQGPWLTGTDSPSLPERRRRWWTLI